MALCPGLLVFLLEALKGLTSLAMVTKAMSAVGAASVEWLGASVSLVDGHVTDGYSSVAL